jgi:hypothetical protein
MWSPKVNEAGGKAGDFPHALYVMHDHVKARSCRGTIKLRQSSMKRSYWGKFGHLTLPNHRSTFCHPPFANRLRHVLRNLHPHSFRDDRRGGFPRRGHNCSHQRNRRLQISSKVDRVLLKNGAAIGAATADGRKFKSRVVVSNTNPFDLFRKMIGDKEVLAGEEAKWKNYSVSLSCFQVFLGLKKDLVKELGITDSEIFLEPSYDPETGYAGALNGDVEHGGIGISLYDNIYHGYSPEGKNTVGLLTLQGYGP